MYRAARSFFTDYNDSNNVNHNRTNKLRYLKLVYTDKKNELNLDLSVDSSSNTTIHELIKYAIDSFYLDGMSPDDIYLASYCVNKRHYELRRKRKEVTLQELGIKDNFILYFEPTATAGALKSCKLTIIGPDETKKIDYQWYRAKTTLNMLLEYTIEKFSLQSIERERIHLLTIIHELDFHSCSHVRLCELDIYNGMSIHVKIIPPLTSTNTNENTDVYVEYIYDNTKRILNVPITETISEIKAEIEKQFEGRFITDFTMYNEAKEELYINDSNRSIQSFGIKSGQTISARFNASTQKINSSIENNQNKESKKSSSSSNTNQNHDTVTVICKFPSDDSATAQISVKDTVQQLIKKTEPLKPNSQLIVADIYSQTIKVNLLTEKFRCLTDLGFKPNDLINVIMINKPSTSSSIENNKNEESKKLLSSSNTSQNDDKITVICKSPSYDSVTTVISVKDTVQQLIKKIESVKPNHRLVLHEVYSNTITIDLSNDNGRCLADLGFKPNDTIHVILNNKSPIHSSIVSRRSPSPSSPDKLVKSQRIHKTPIGLDNLGNSCYMNSALQCLAHIPPLTDYFLEDFNHTHMNNNDNKDNDWNPYNQIGNVTGAYAELLWNLWKYDEDEYNNDSFKPIRIKEKIGEKDSRFATTDQHDAQEFMTFILDIIHEELKTKNKNDRNTIIKKLFFGEMTSTIQCMACMKKVSSTNPISFLSIPLNQQERTLWINFISKTGKDYLKSIAVPIHGRVENAVDAFTEMCNQPSLFYYILPMAHDGELDFKTPLNEIPSDELVFMEQDEPSRRNRPARSEVSFKKVTLMDCLEDFFAPEILEDGWACQEAKCKKTTTAAKQLQFHTLPPVLIFQFKRFSHENGFDQKVETFVHYPITGLNLKKFLPSSSSLSQEDAIYDLVAVTNHMGSIFAGHYTVYARHSISNKNEWYRFDDSSVTRVKPQDYEYEIVSRDAYLLFYINRKLLIQTTAV